MSRYGVLAVGPTEVWIFGWRESLDPSIGALFADSESEDGFVYRSNARTVRDRLDLLGYSRRSATKTIENGWESRANVDTHTASSSPNELVEDFAKHLGDQPVWPEIHNPQAQRLQDELGYIWGQDERMLKYIVDRLPDGAPVVLDLSQLDGGTDFNPSSTLCEELRSEERVRAVGALPTIVLVEGSTDAEFLRAALEIRRPDLVGFMTFMDYAMKPSGGVSNVIQGLRSLAAAGVGNRVVALLDNDAAGVDGLRQLKSTPLPANMRATLLPDVDLLTSYPALGPDGLTATNIDGRAASLEVYLGIDVLSTPDGLEPVQWGSYLAQVTRYQGELREKTEVQRRFRAKVQRIRAGLPLVEADWLELDAVLNRILDAARPA